MLKLESIMIDFIWLFVLEEIDLIPFFSPNSLGISLYYSKYCRLRVFPTLQLVMQTTNPARCEHASEGRTDSRKRGNANVP